MPKRGNTARQSAPDTPNVPAEFTDAHPGTGPANQGDSGEQGQHEGVAPGALAKAGQVKGVWRIPQPAFGTARA
ncbi:hypothetical protein ACE4ZU_26660, partial [Salmonella enterica]|uniref:hypothetical protein n=1 Tax=Salmonella enterica TaxID=28901 RepID=UPI003D27BFC5